MGVEIHLNNAGTDAYTGKPFGPKIIIQRKISDRGTKYLLKNSEGKLVSERVEDLRKIKDWFNIQVENPMSILNQDTSRNFLNSRKEEDKYKFFQKATQLEKVQDLYEE